MDPSKLEEPTGMHRFTRTRAGFGLAAPCRTALGAVTLALGVAVASQARAQEPVKSDSGRMEADRSLGHDPSLALDPTAPQTASLPGGLTPAFGTRPQDDKEWRADFHGFLTAPLVAGINKRRNTNGSETSADGQNGTVLHTPPLVPDDLETFSHTGVIPTTYGQLNFSYGTSAVSANISILARQANVSESFLEPAHQVGINDLFLRVVPKIGDRARLQFLVGAFSARYGTSGEYDEGRYGTPLIARVNGMGIRTDLKWKVGDFTLLLEHGLQGQTNKAGSSITPDLWNNYANPSEGTTFVHHVHGGVGYRFLTVGAHFLSAWSQDDRSANVLQPDGSITVLAGDARLSLGRFGHLYAAVASTKATHARSVSRIFSVLNTPGGPGLMDNYLGSQQDGGDGTGSLTTIGGQYDLSLARLVSYPTEFRGDGPDIFVSLYGMAVQVASNVDRFDGVTKVKYGAEATYSLLPWFAVSARYDRVVPGRMMGIPPSSADLYVDDARYNFAVISPRLIFRTGWLSTDQVVLQYSRWMNGAFTAVRSGEPPKEDYRVFPDSDTISLSGSMWW